MRFLLLIPLLFLVTGCQTVSSHQQAVNHQSGENLTVGKVQREIKVGMSSADVVSALGSPNVVTTDDERREVWVYDKIATETAYSTSSGGVSSLILGGFSNVPVGGGLGGGFNKSTGAVSKTQKTLTIIVKFDKKSKVRDFAYHSSKF